jgi:nucleotide-binding universal stress UspA family protein
MPARFSPGAVIDGFVLEEKLHQGTMSAIWRVRRQADPDVESSERMAMKIPLVSDYDDPAAIVGFEVEQMILPTLSGPHFPRFVAAGDFSKQPYIVMELLKGESLRNRLAGAPLPPEDVAGIGARIATALHALHMQHVIHLDLKPSNVMFRETGVAVLLDFGLSRHDALPDLLQEEFRLPMGTGPYISPEQVRHVRSDPRSDLFSLGVLLYHLATGERPFGNPTTIRGLRRRLYRDPIPPRALLPNFPPWLQEVILACLEVDPHARPATAAQVAFQLQHPEQIVLGARAERRVRDGALAVARRRMRSLGEEPKTAGILAHAPIVLLAIDLSQESQALTDAMRTIGLRVVHAEPGARLACVTVLKTSRIGMDVLIDEQGQSLHVRRLVELKHWSRPLGLPPEKITHHVLEAPDPAAAIVAFARTNNVDQIVIGSRGSSSLRRYLGSVSSQVVAQAGCTVTVVKRAFRAPEGDVALDESGEPSFRAD